MRYRHKLNLVSISQGVIFNLSLFLINIILFSYLNSERLSFLFHFKTENFIYRILELKVFCFNFNVKIEITG